MATDAFQEADTVGITRPCTKHNWLVKDVAELPRHPAWRLSRSRPLGRPGPVVVDIPKDVQFRRGAYVGPQSVRHRTYRPKTDPDAGVVARAVEMMAAAKRPLFYTGGGIVNSGPEASRLMTELVKATGFPITSTLMGLGAFPASEPEWLGLVGMHGTYEANNAMHDCDLMVCLGARFDDRVTGRVDLFSPGIEKDSSRYRRLADQQGDPRRSGHCRGCDQGAGRDAASLEGADAQARSGAEDWWKQIDAWAARKKSLDFKNSATIIKPQYAVDRLYELTRGREVYITTEVGQHQMWAAQRFKFEKPNHWMTSGGLGTMGYGLPAAVGVQIAHPGALVIDIAGEASVQMTMQEMSTAVQYNLPIKIFILNNEYMGMVRQWQQLLHGGALFPFLFRGAARFRQAGRGLWLCRVARDAAR